MDVTDVLRDRMGEPAGLRRMVTLSIGVHVALAATILVIPGGLLTRTTEPPKTLMIISLGGGEGPNNGGMTTMGGRPVQVQTPPDEAPKREAVRPPAAKSPEMTMPLPNAKPVKATPGPAVKEAPEEARGKTPTKGAQIAAGSAVAQTATRGLGFGLSTGGGPGSGSTLDVADFCCPDYIAVMVERIRSVWDQAQNGATGLTVIKFTIRRDGTITNSEIEMQSGTSILDTAALRAVRLTRSLPPLPDGFPGATLPVHLHFKYER